MSNPVQLWYPLFWGEGPSCHDRASTRSRTSVGPWRTPPRRRRRSCTVAFWLHLQVYQEWPGEVNVHTPSNLHDHHLLEDCLGDDCWLLLKELAFSVVGAGGTLTFKADLTWLPNPYSLNKYKNLMIPF